MEMTLFRRSLPTSDSAASASTSKRFSVKRVPWQKHHTGTTHFSSFAPSIAANGKALPDGVMDAKAGVSQGAR